MADVGQERFEAEAETFGGPWFSPRHLVRQQCWMLEDGSAGVQIVPHTWSISSLGGLPAPVDMVARAALPLLGVRPSCFRFGTAHFWWGRPDRWAALFEHVMQLEELQAVVITGDPVAQHWQQLVEHVPMGRVGSMVGSNRLTFISNLPQGGPVVFTPLNAM